jgi:hypothetical protein
MEYATNCPPGKIVPEFDHSKSNRELEAPQPAAVVEQTPSTEALPPVESGVPLVEPTESIQHIEALAARLESEWHSPAQLEPEPYHAVDSQAIEIGDRVECVVVFWHPERKFGFGRKVGDRGRKGRRDGLYFSVADVITTGEETLRVGSRVLGAVTGPRPGQTDLRLIDVEIFQEAT